MANNTTADLIQQVKWRQSIPDSGVAYSDQVLCDFLDQSNKGFIVPALEAMQEEYFVVTRDYQMPEQPPYSLNSPPTDVGNVINIPSESTGYRLRDVYVISSDGTPYNLQRLTPTQAASQNMGNQAWGPGYNNQTVGIGGFFLQGNQVQIFPYGLASGKLIRLTFQRAPGTLCLTSAAGQVVSIAGDVAVLDKVLPWFGSSQVAANMVTHVNAISYEDPHDYVTDATAPVVVYTSPTPLSDMPLVNCVGNVITLPAGTGANIRANDWICVKGQSVFAQMIPQELLPSLVQRASAMMLESAGDREGMQIANGTFDTMLKAAIFLLTPRVLGKPIKVLPTNSPFRASRGSSWGRW